MKLLLNGSELPGCTHIERRFSRPAWSTTVGGQGDVVRSRQRRNDVGQLVAYFEERSTGHEHLSKILSDDIIELRVEGHDTVPDFTSRGWIDRGESRGTTWVFDGVTLPR